MSKYNDTPNWRRQTRTPPAKLVHLVSCGMAKIPYREKFQNPKRSYRKDAVIRVGGGIFCIGCSITAMWLFLHVSLHVSGWHGFPILLLAGSLLLLSIYISIKGKNVRETDKNAALTVIICLCLLITMLCSCRQVIEWVAGKPCFYMLPNGNTEGFYCYLGLCLILYTVGLVFALCAVLLDKEDAHD